MTWLYSPQLAAPGVAGEPVTIRGRVLDGDGDAVPDAVLELWQADAHGRYAHPEDRRDDTGTQPAEAAFQGFGRVATDNDGRFEFSTIKPGPVAGPEGRLQAPHILVSVFARGLLGRVVTRIYFPDDPANADDYVLNLVPAERRATLIAQLDKTEPAGAGRLHWDVVLQGQGETVFFDI